MVKAEDRLTHRWPRSRRRIRAQGNRYSYDRHQGHAVGNAETYYYVIISSLLCVALSLYNQSSSLYKQDQPFVSTELSVLLPVYDFLRLSRPRWLYEGSVACDTDMHSRCSLMSSPPERHDFGCRYPLQHYTALSLRNQSPQSMSVDGTSSETRLSTVSPFNMPSGCTTKRPFPAQDLFSRNLYLGWPLSKVCVVAGCT